MNSDREKRACLGSLLAIWLNVSIDGKTFEVYEVAKQSVMIEHLIEDRLTRTSPVVIPNVFGGILAKIIEYCNRMVTKPSSGANDIELNSFVSELTIGCYNYLDIKNLLSLTCEHVLDLIKCKDPTHIHRLLNITLNFHQKKRKGCEALIRRLLTK
ncbi:hypothetical protein M9H77_13392 [Catharanthus roseus]|uniref:Uncharacterized protein n=1 Tax=Catharanthus roseus TaxID=4058 RepID=A0ACC0BKA5_CATRO|nr:hypothetical protein M9H77_13392 [Catharanthus roseus]